MLRKTAQVVLCAAILVGTISWFGCQPNEDEQTVFRRFPGRGLAGLSKAGHTILVRQSVSQPPTGTVILEEAFYNDSDIWVGLVLRDVGIEYLSFQFSNNGTEIGIGAHGGIRDKPSSLPGEVYLLLSPVWDDHGNITRLPNTLPLQLMVREYAGWKREFAFEVTLERSEQVVIRRTMPGSGERTISVPAAQ